jgi:hypothetical protein
MGPILFDALGPVVTLGFPRDPRSSTAGLAWFSALGALGCTGCGRVEREVDLLPAPMSDPDSTQPYPVWVDLSGMQPSFGGL